MAQEAKGNVIVVSEWLPKENCEEEIFAQFQKLASLTLEKEKGCLQYYVSRQVPHPGAQGETKYKIMLFQEYESTKDFDKHCDASYVSDFFDRYVGNEDTAMIEDWRCRLFAPEPLRAA